MTLNSEAKNFIKERAEQTYLLNDSVQLVSDEFDAVAKFVDVQEEDKKTTVYYIRKGNGDLFDPNGPYNITRSNVARYPFTKVENEVFELYLRYLKERRSILLTQARREDMVSTRR